MKTSQMSPSKYLKKEDFEKPRLFTIERFNKENVARQNEPDEYKWVMYFHGEQRGLVLNKNNLSRAALALGSDDTDDWIGKRIVAFHDPTVEFGGKLVGGIRLRAPKLRAQAAAPPPPPPPEEDEFDEEDPDDDVPF
jgi:hypothetical protein